MASKNDLTKSDHRGVYYREHPINKHGVRKDRQWVIVQRLNGKLRTSTLGWSSQGIKELHAIGKVHEYLENNKWNRSNPDKLPKPICKGDEDLAAAKLAIQLEQERVIERHKNMSINDFWDTFYLPLIESGAKEGGTVDVERSIYENWIKRSLGSKRLIDLKRLDWSRLVKDVLSVGRSPRTVHYVASIILQMWSLAFDEKVINIQPPRRKTLGLPDIDNERTGVFTPDQAEEFLLALKKRSYQWHNIGLLSLLTGMRASEIYKLKKKDIDFDKNLIFLESPKKHKSQYLSVGDKAKELLKIMIEKSRSDQPFVVTSRKGGKIKSVSKTVARVIEDLKYNEGRDKREKLSFHSLRHTTATWLLEEGENIYRVSKLLRHSTVKVTEQRYSHLSDDTIKKTADKIGEVFSVEKLLGNPNEVGG
ncbi:MAG: site-specific integrase [Desulfuromonadales bacterium]|nr:site-specific integrase [Desulfuromonadales bacterium]